MNERSKKKSEAQVAAELETALAHLAVYYEITRTDEPAVVWFRPRPTVESPAMFLGQQCVRRGYRPNVLADFSDDLGPCMKVKLVPLF